MTFAPPRPQSIYGRSAPPQAQIDWRLGAQTGQNIGAGIQSAIASLTKGWEKFQEDKEKKANQEGAEKALIALGASPEDAKGFAKFPEATHLYKTVMLEKQKVDAAAEVTKQEAARKAAEESRAQGKYAADRFKEAREIVPDLMIKDDQGNARLDPFEIGQLHPDLQKAVLNLPDETVSSAFQNKEGYRDMLKFAAKGKEGFNDIKKNPAAHKAWKDLPDAEKNRLIRERPTTIIIGGTPQAAAYAAETGGSLLPEGRGLILDAEGNLKAHFDAKTDSESRFGQFKKAIRTAKNDPDYELTEKEVNAYFLADKGMDMDGLNDLLLIHVEDPEKRLEILELYIATGGQGVGADPANTPSTGGGQGKLEFHDDLEM